MSQKNIAVFLKEKPRLYQDYFDIKQSTEGLFDERGDLVGMHRIPLLMGGFGSGTQRMMHILALVTFLSVGVLLGIYLGMPLPFTPDILALKVAALIGASGVFMVYMLAFYRHQQLFIAKQGQGQPSTHVQGRRSELPMVGRANEKKGSPRNDDMERNQPTCKI